MGTFVMEKEGQRRRLRMTVAEYIRHAALRSRNWRDVIEPVQYVPVNNDKRFADSLRQIGLRS